MRNSSLLLLITFFAVASVSAQVKIGDNPQNIDPSSVLELESTDKVLVITRVTTAQMNAIVPSEGALCFNTDLQSVHYYNGTQWVNIGGGGGTGGPLTADPIVNTQPTIVITPTATGDNLEVAPNSIRSEQIVDGGINGVDIQDGSLGPGKLQDFSITQEKLSENSVGAFALDNDSFGVSAFNNDAGYITAGDVNVVSGDPGNVISSDANGAAFYDDTNLLMDIMDNTDAIAMDDDQSAANEIQNLTLNGTEIGLTLTAGTIDIGSLIPAGGTDDQNLTLSGNVIEIEDGNTIDLTPILGSGGTDDQNLTLTGNIIEIEDGNTIDLTPILGAGGTDNQTAAEVPYDPTTSGLTATDTQAAIDEIAAAGGSDDQTAAEVTYDPTTSGLTATDTQAAIDEIAAAGGSDDQTAAEVTYDPATSGLTATDTQSAIDEIAATGGSDDQTAAEVPYDPVASGLNATNTQAAIDEIVGSGVINEQDITLETTQNEIQLLESDGTTISSVVKLDGTTIEAIDNGTDNVIRLADGAVTETKLAPMGAATDGDIIKWNTTLNAGSGGWEVGTNAGHTGITNSIFFADDTTGAPTTATNPENEESLVWDQANRLGYGQLQIGLDGNTAPTDVSKVVIAETISPGADIMYPLLIQTSAPAITNASTGILFSPEVYGPGTLSKGALIYQRTGDWARGDFHFLQSDTDNTILPVTNDKAFTVKNNKDIVIYGGIQIDGAPGTGLGTANQVLSSTGTGVQWVDAAVAINDVDINDGLEYGASVGYNVKVDGATLELMTDAIQVADNGITTDQIAPNTIVADDIDTDAVTSDEIADGTIALADLNQMGAGDGQVLKWNNTTMVWEPAADAVGGGTIPMGTAGSIFFSDGASGLVENNAQLRWDETNTRLSLGTPFTAASQQKLNVQGNIRTVAINASANTTTPVYRFDGDADTGMYSPGANEVGFLVNGNSVLEMGELSGQRTILANGSLELEEELVDITGNAGTTGQMLTATGAGVQWVSPKLIATGKANGGSSIVSNGGSPGGTAGNYTVSFTTNAPNDDYIIQLTVQGNYRIYVSAQRDDGFDVVIIDNATDAPTTTATEWFYTATNL